MAQYDSRWRCWAQRGVLVAALVTMPLAAKAETLADALVGAYNHSGLLKQQRAVLRATDESAAQQASTLLPVFQWSANLQRQIGARTATSRRIETTNITAQITGSWQLYDFGADAIRIEAAKENVLAGRNALLQVEQNILQSAVVAFMTVRATAETVAIRQNNIGLLEQELQAANDRFDVGEVTRTDVALAQSALAAARSDLADARADFQQAREDYRVAVGRYPGNLAPPPGLPRLEQNIERARAFALRNHPQLRQAQHAVASAELGILANEADIKPNVSLSGTLSLSDNLSVDGGTGESFNIGIGASQTIYQGGLLSSQIRTSIAQRDQARNNLHEVRHDIFADVGIAYADLQSSFAQIEATQRRIRSARVAFDGVREEAKLGARTTLDVLDAEQELLDARAALVLAQASQYIAAYNVLQSMGLLTAENLKLPVQIYDPTAYFELVKDGVAKNTRRGRQLDRVLKALNK